MNDIKDLELNYKLRENWLDSNNTFEKPFNAEISNIQAPIHQDKN